ncbi:MAG: sel1 repeat family protein [Prosthecobacter sp.]|nr:sel1 repeat family protein [Prosthecobacter sp.]
MKIASPAAYEEAVKLFAQAGYDVKPRTEQASPPAASNSMPATSQANTVKFSDLSLDEVRALSKSGNADAQFALACRYYTGDEVEKDLKTAYNLLIESANRGNADAIFALGVHYQRGEGVAQNSVESYAWFYVASQLGYAGAAESLKECGANLTLAQKSQGTQRGMELQQQIKASPPVTR